MNVCTVGVEPVNFRDVPVPATVMDIAVAIIIMRTKVVVSLDCSSP